MSRSNLKTNPARLDPAQTRSATEVVSHGLGPDLRSGLPARDRPEGSRRRRARYGLRRLTLVLCLLGSLQPGHARKGSSSDDACLADTVCGSLYEEARRLSKGGDFATALAAYQGAYRRQAVPWLLINIGRTLHKLGRPAEALLQYRRYLADEPNGPPDRLQTVNDYIAQAEKAVAEKAAATAPAGDKPSDPAAPKPDGQVGTDGAKDVGSAAAAGKSPPEIEPPPGPAPVALTPPPTGADGRREPDQPGTSPASSPSAASPNGSGGITASPAPSPASAPRSPAPSESRRPLPTYFWAGLGVGGGLLAIGAATGIAALVLDRNLNDTAYAGTLPSSLLDQQSRVRGLSISTDVLLGGGAATVGVVTVVMLLGRKSAPAPAK